MFVDKLKELRKLNNHTQELLAEKLFVSRSLVAKWEQGRAYPSINELEKITEIYNVEFDELMNKEELKHIYGIVVKNKIRLKRLFMAIVSLLLIICTTTVTVPFFIQVKEYNQKNIISSHRMTFAYNNIILDNGEVIYVDENIPIYLNDEKINYNNQDVLLDSFSECDIEYKTYDIKNGYNKVISTDKEINRIDLVQPLSLSTIGFCIDFAKNTRTDHNYTPNLNSDSVVYCYFEKGGKLVSNINVSFTKTKSFSEELNITYYEYLYSFKYDFDKMKDFYLSKNEDKNEAEIPIWYIYEDMSFSEFAPHNYLGGRGVYYLSLDWKNGRNMGFHSHSGLEHYLTIVDNVYDPSYPYKYQTVLIKIDIDAFNR